MRSPHILRNTEGSIFILWGLLAVLVIGFIGLGAEVNAWYRQKSDLQKATDSAALAAAGGLGTTACGSGNPACLSGAAVSVMQSNGFPGTQYLAGNPSLTITTPYPTATNTNEVQVCSSLVDNKMFASVVQNGGTTTITVCATATSAPQKFPLALDATGLHDGTGIKLDSTYGVAVTNILVNNAAVITTAGVNNAGPDSTLNANNGTSNGAIYASSPINCNGCTSITPTPSTAIPTITNPYGGNNYNNPTLVPGNNKQLPPNTNDPYGSASPTNFTAPPVPTALACTDSTIRTVASGRPLPNSTDCANTPGGFPGSWRGGTNICYFGNSSGVYCGAFDILSNTTPGSTQVAPVEMDGAQYYVTPNYCATIGPNNTYNCSCGTGICVYAPASVTFNAAAILEQVSIQTLSAPVNWIWNPVLQIETPQFTPYTSTPYTQVTLNAGTYSGGVLVGWPAVQTGLGLTNAGFQSTIVQPQGASPVNFTALTGVIMPSNPLKSGGANIITLNPGVYDGIILNGSETLTMNPPSLANPPVNSLSPIQTYFIYSDSAGAYHGLDIGANALSWPCPAQGTGGTFTLSTGTYWGIQTAAPISLYPGVYILGSDGIHDGDGLIQNDGCTASFYAPGSNITQLPPNSSTSDIPGITMFFNDPTTGDYNYPGSPYTNAFGMTSPGTITLSAPTSLSAPYPGLLFYGENAQYPGSAQAGQIALGDISNWSLSGIVQAPAWQFDAGYGFGQHINGPGGGASAPDLCLQMVVSSFEADATSTDPVDDGPGAPDVGSITFSTTDANNNPCDPTYQQIMMSTGNGGAALTQ